MSGSKAEAIEMVARALCAHARSDCDALIPGNVILFPLDDLEAWESPEGAFIDSLADNGTRPPDGMCRGEKAHFCWREYIAPAQAAYAALQAAGYQLP